MQPHDEEALQAAGLDNGQSFGQWLKAQRERLGLSKEKLAAMASTSPKTLRRYEDGGMPDVRVRQRIEAALTNDYPPHLAYERPATPHMPDRPFNEPRGIYGLSTTTAISTHNFDAYLDTLREIHDTKGEGYDDSPESRYGNWRGAVGCEPWVACWNRVREKVERVNNLVRKDRVTPEALAEELQDIGVLVGIAWVLNQEAD